MHIKKKFVTANLSKELRKKYGRRNFGIRKNDRVKIMNGEFRKKEGKITGVFLKIGKITIEGIQRKKRDGSKVDIKIEPSNVQIIELDTNDKKRTDLLKNKPLEKVSKENKTETIIKPKENSPIAANQRRKRKNESSKKTKIPKNWPVPRKGTTYMVKPFQIYQIAFHCL